MSQVWAHAPVRIADVGGWTDTWFAGEGAVTNVAVEPGAWARVTLGPAPAGSPPAPPTVSTPDLASPSALLRRVLDRWWADRRDCLVGDRSVLSVEVGAAPPPGSSLGTSAAVLVALAAALATAAGDDAEPDVLARRAFEAETGPGGRESGVQDHVAAAWGGISHIAVRHPGWIRTAVAPPEPIETDLRTRLVTFHLGGGHDSSALHRAVIAGLEEGDQRGAAALRRLSRLADAAARALRDGRLEEWSATLTEATEAQAQLHPDLVCDRARRLIEAAMTAGAVGAKVNGAGGEGGTVTVVGPSDPERRLAMVRSLTREIPRLVALDLRLSEGARAGIGAEGLDRD